MACEAQPIREDKNERRYPGRRFEPTDVSKPQGP
jgi:hypothetical protein